MSANVPKDDPFPLAERALREVKDPRAATQLWQHLCRCVSAIEADRARFSHVTDVELARRRQVVAGFRPLVATTVLAQAVESAKTSAEDEVLDDMHAALGRLGVLSQHLNTELAQQDALLEQVHVEVDEASARLPVAQSKLERLLSRHHSATCRWACLALLVCVALVLGVLLLA